MLDQSKPDNGRPYTKARFTWDILKFPLLYAAFVAFVPPDDPLGRFLAAVSAFMVTGYIAATVMRYVGEHLASALENL